MTFKVLQRGNSGVFNYFIAESVSPNLFSEVINGNAAQSVGVKASSQTLPSKDQERLKSGSSSHHTPAMAPPGVSSSFPRPVYPGPLLSHVPVVRPSPHLHPNMVQRMLAQGIQPQQLGPALMQAGQSYLLEIYRSIYKMEMYIKLTVSHFDALMDIFVHTRYISITC